MFYGNQYVLCCCRRYEVVARRGVGVVAVRRDLLPEFCTCVAR